MNYIWDTLIKARRKQIDISDLNFRLADIYSPYLELAMSDINFQLSTGVNELEVNPFYRFEHIFSRMFSPDNDELVELRSELLNCMLRYIYNIDIYAGMNNHEFMRLYIKRDIENGCFGEEIQDNWKLFDIDEQDTIINQMINMYKTGSSIEVARMAILGVFHDGYVYFNNVTGNEILIFAGIKEREIYKSKMDFLIEMFLPLDFKYKIYWSKHFGIIGNDELMIEDSIVLY